MVEKTSVYRGYTYFVVFQERGGWRCGYVRIPEDHVLCEMDYDDVNVNCHGGLTFSGKLKDISGWLIGFDCAHFGDGYDFEKLKLYMKPEDYAIYEKLNIPLWSGAHIWTTEEVEEECKSMIDQIINNYDNDGLIIT